MAHVTLLQTVLCAALCIFATASHRSTNLPSLLQDARSRFGLQAGAPDTPWSARVTLQRSLDGSGFHQTLHYTFEGPAASSVASKRSCQLALVQPLPPDLFADPYQLSDIVRYHRDFEFELLGPLDLELPAPVCQDTALVIRANVTLGAGGSSGWRRQLAVPLHAKYPAPVSHTGAGTSHSAVAVPLPWVAEDCSAAASGAAPVLQPPERPSKGQELTWRVPAGDLDELGGVAAATTAIAAACCALVIASAARWRDPSLAA